MIGGFMASGSPYTVIDAIKESAPKGLTLICTDTATHNFKTNVVNGIGILVANKQFKKIFASHIGLNQETPAADEFRRGPRSSWCPRAPWPRRSGPVARALGGILTPTGVGTEVQEGKQVITVDNKAYLLELPLTRRRGLREGQEGRQGRQPGLCRGPARNFNPHDGHRRQAGGCRGGGTGGDRRDRSQRCPHRVDLRGFHRQS